MKNRRYCPIRFDIDLLMLGDFSIRLDANVVEFDRWRTARSNLRGFAKIIQITFFDGFLPPPVF